MPVPQSDFEMSRKSSTASNSSPMKRNTPPYGIVTPSTQSVASSIQSVSPKKTIEISRSKAAYLCVKDSIADDIKNLDEFELILQHAGYNPTSNFLARYWNPKANPTPTITFKEFDYICQTEPTPRKIDLLASFRNMDVEGNGLLPHDDFVKAMTAKGSQKLPKDLVLSLISNPQYNKCGKFDYSVFCKDVFDTSNQLINVAKEKVTLKEEQLAINSGTYKVKKKSSPLKLPDRSSWQCTQMKGAFYFEADSIISHQFTFNVGVEGYFEISISPHEIANLPVDCQLFLFRLLEDNGNRSPDAKYHFVARTPLVLQKGFISNESLEYPKSWTGHLTKGTYLLIPSTTGCLLKRRKSQPVSDVRKLVISPQEEEVELTKDFAQVLKDIYHQVDLDGNGTLSRTEFNLFNWRTSGEEVQDEEWQVVEENFSLKDGELTLEGFMQLHQMEAEDNGGDSAELWITLNAMGYNVSLAQDEAAIFDIQVKSELEKPKLEVSGLKSGGTLLDKATIKCIMDESKRSKNIDKTNDVLLFREETGSCSSFVIQNRSGQSAKINLDFTSSQNVVINHPHMAFTTRVTPKSTLFVAHLIPKDILKEHQVILKETFV